MASSALSMATLFLVVDSGPKKVKTLHCKPGDLIHIGRVVRGNTLAIRDPSISEKHLTFRFLQKVSLWAVTDLGSSNGTYVNGTLIARDDPVPLADGDVIRIGARTSISVQIFPHQAESLPLRSHSKAVAPDENREIEPEKINGKRMVSGSMRKNNGLQVVGSDRRTGRVPRESARAGSTSVSGVAMAEDMAIDRKCGRTTRASARAGSTSVSGLAMAEDVATDRKCGRATMASARARSTNVSGVAIAEDMAIVVSDSESSAGVAEDIQLKKIRTGSEEEDPSGFGKQKAHGAEVKDDLDNMTMDEWLHRMEEYLPKSINRVAEEIIANLRKKSSLFDEYISQVSIVTDE